VAENNAAAGVFAEEKANEHAWDKNKRREKCKKAHKV
jgi:hypothetical protein